MIDKKYPILKKQYALTLRYKESIIYPLCADDIITSAEYNYEKINQSAAEILSLCNGENTIDDIIHKMAYKYNQEYEQISDMVVDFLNYSSEKQYIMFSDEELKYQINIGGDFSLYTPINAAFEITRGCPLSCRHCYNDSGKTLEDELSTEQVYEVMDKLENLGVHKLMITGGEPTNRQDFLDIVKYACSKFTGITIASSGFLITEEIASKLSLYRNKIVVQISLDGTQEHHDGIRCVQGAYERAIDAIKYLRKYGIIVVIGTTINGENFEDMEQIAQVANELDVLQVTYGVTTDMGRAKINKLSSQINIDRFFESIKNLHNEFLPKGLYINYSEETKCENCITDKISCGAGITQIAIRPNGDVSPCVNFAYSMGNIVIDDIYNIFSCDKMGIFTKLPAPSKKMCGNCEKIDECKNCIACAVSSDVEVCAWYNLFKTSIGD
ncbi:MAG: PqqD family peptide modification chaperone [Lachnospiraceae bacterium]|nr:PqqD family peptide modification chaperone [Lachnospiraceae bacterium]